MLILNISLLFLKTKLLDDIKSKVKLSVIGSFEDKDEYNEDKNEDKDNEDKDEDTKICNDMMSNFSKEKEYTWSLNLPMNSRI